MRIEKWMFDRHLSFICFACLHCAMWCYLYLNINVAGLPKNIMILSRLGLHSFFNPPKSSISPHFLEEMSRDVKKPHGMQLTPWVFRIEFFSIDPREKWYVSKNMRSMVSKQLDGVLSNHTIAWGIFWVMWLFLVWVFFRITIEPLYWTWENQWLIRIGQSLLDAKCKDYWLLFFKKYGIKIRIWKILKCLGPRRPLALPEPTRTFDLSLSEPTYTDPTFFGLSQS